MAISDAAARLDGIAADLACRQSTQGERFAMTLQGRRFTERKAAGGGLMRLITGFGWDGKDGAVIGQIGGFDLSLSVVRDLRRRPVNCVMVLHRAGPQRLEVPEEPSALGLIARLESALARFEAEQAEQEDRRTAAERRLADFEPRIGEPFELEAELAAKRAEHDRLGADLAATATAEPTQAEIDAKTAFEQAFGVVIQFPGRSDADEDLEATDEPIETV